MQREKIRERLLHYDAMCSKLETIKSFYKGHPSLGILEDLEKLLDLSAELATCDPYEGHEERIIEEIYEILS